MHLHSGEKKGGFVFKGGIRICGGRGKKGDRVGGLMTRRGEMISINFKDESGPFEGVVEEKRKGIIYTSRGGAA